MILKRLFSVAFFVMLFSFVAPSTVSTARANTDKSLTGIASYYAAKFEGRLTATGEIFKHALYTAASNVFRLNTWVRVTNLKNGKSVIVKVNDRMHPRMHRKGRVIDLSRSAAQSIGLIGKGLIRVKVEEVPEGTEA